jgi:hypothetical protein
MNHQIILFNAPAVQIWSMKKIQQNKKTNEIY